MKFQLSAFGFELGAGYDKERAEDEAIRRAAMRIIKTEQRQIAAQVMAEQIRKEDAERRAKIEAATEKLRAEIEAKARAAGHDNPNPTVGV